MSFRSLGGLWLGCALALLLRPSPLPVQAADCQGNLLQNADFEGTFPQRGRPELEVAEAWNPWWDGNPGTDGYNYIPEYHPSLASQDSRRVSSGAKSQHMYTLYATHTGGIYQIVSALPGTEYVFSIEVQVWSSSGDDSSVSTDHGEYSVFVGFSGSGTDKFWEVERWAGPHTSYDRWSRVEVRGTARGSQVSVWTRGTQLYRVKHNHSYWDHACLQALSTPTPTASPTPPATPSPTPSPTAEATPTPPPTAAPTAVPTATQTPTPAPVVHVPLSAEAATPPPARRPTAAAAPTPPPPAAGQRLVGWSGALSALAAAALAFYLYGLPRLRG